MALFLYLLYSTVMTDFAEIPDDFEIACESFLMGLLSESDYSDADYDFEQRFNLYFILSLACENKINVPALFDQEDVCWDTVKDVILSDDSASPDEAAFAWRIHLISRCMHDGNALDLISGLYETYFESEEEEESWLELSRTIFGPLPIDKLTDEERQILLTFAEEQRSGEAAKYARWQAFLTQAVEQVKEVLGQYCGEHDDLENFAISIVMLTKNIEESIPFMEKYRISQTETYLEKIQLPAEAFSLLVEITSQQYKNLVMQQPDDLDNS